MKDKIDIHYCCPKSDCGYYCDVTEMPRSSKDGKFYIASYGCPNPIHDDWQPLNIVIDGGE